MSPRTSLAARVSFASLVSAALAAAIASIVACGFAEALLTSATDRSLQAAAGELARELDRPGHAPIETLIRDEQDEGTSAGIRFSVVGPTGETLGGDVGGGRFGDGCATVDSLRLCAVSTGTGTRVIAGTLHSSRIGLFAIAALAAAALAALVAWALGRVLARRALLPLVRLQDRIAALRLESAPNASTGPSAKLGESEGVAEVDALRTAVELLHARMMDALAHSSRFAANAAHELRTPLTIVRAELELLAESAPGSPSEPAESNDNSDTREAVDRVGAPSARPRESIRRALRKVQHLQDLTERLLLLATPETEDDARELVSLRDVVEDTVLDLDAADRGRVTVEPGDDVLVRGDAAALGIVVSNGVSNALKFGARVAIEVTAKDKSAVLAIDDDGPGVSEDDRSKMFEPFARGDGTNAPGHGIGLALVAHVAKRHRGSARLAPTRKWPSGTRLEVKLPISEV